MSSPSGFTQLVVFRLQSREYAMPVRDVVEVVRMVALTPIPEMPSWLPGAINLRGHAIPVMDLRLRLGIPAPIPGLDTPILVAKAGQLRFGVIADVMVEVLTLPGAAVEAIGETDDVPHVAVALARVENRLIVVLDVHRLHASIPVID